MTNLLDCNNHCVTTTVYHCIMTALSRPLCDHFVKNTVWQPLCNDICVTMQLRDEITLLWITKVWPFWRGDSQDKKTTEMKGLWGGASDAHLKNVHIVSQKLQCPLFTINNEGLRRHTVDPCQLLSLGERFFLLTLIVLQLYICIIDWCTDTDTYIRHMYMYM
jgi:hypothetical protein